MRLRTQYQTTFDEGKGPIPIAAWTLEHIQAVAKYLRDSGAQVSDIRTLQVVTHND